MHKYEWKRKLEYKKKFKLDIYSPILSHGLETKFILSFLFLWNSYHNFKLAEQPAGVFLRLNMRLNFLRWSVFCIVCVCVGGALLWKVPPWFMSTLFESWCCQTFIFILRLSLRQMNSELQALELRDALPPFVFLPPSLSSTVSCTHTSAGLWYLLLPWNKGSILHNRFHKVVRSIVYDE